MIRLLWNSAAGMQAQSFNVDTIADNIANLNTTGFKSRVVRFQDLLYHAGNGSGDPVIPGGSNLMVGQGVKVAEVKTSFQPGPLIDTDRQLDMAIEGDGFFRVFLPDGSEAFTRAGSFYLDASGNLVTAQGERVDLLPAQMQGIKFTGISVDQDGSLSLYDEAGEIIAAGQVSIYRFQNPQGLEAAGTSLWRATVNSGAAVAGRPGDQGFGKLRQRCLETANVNLVAEMTRLILAQRAYELNSRSVRAADEMWSQANQIRR